MNKILTKFLAIFLLISSNTYAFDTTKTLTVIIPFPPGGGVDKVYRPLEQYAINKGIKLVPLYKPGADGTIGLKDLAEKPSDGYTVSITTASSLAVYNTNYSPDSIVTISGLNDTIGAFVSSPNSSIKTIDGLCSSLIQGKDVKFGYGAPGQLLMLQQLIQNCKSKNEPLLVPYKGGAAVIPDLLNGQIEVARLPLPLVIGHINSGKLQLLALSRNKVNGLTAPTIESKFSNWKELDGYGLLAPKNTDSEAIKFWNELVKEYLNNKQVQEQFVENYMVPLSYGPIEFNNIVEKSKVEFLKIKK